MSKNQVFPLQMGFAPLTPGPRWGLHPRPPLWGLTVVFGMAQTLWRQHCLQSDPTIRGSASEAR